MMRHIRRFLNMILKVEAWHSEGEEIDLKKGTNKVLISGVGIGYNKFN